MKKGGLLPSGIAVLTAVALSLFVRDYSILLLVSLGVGLFALAIAVEGCFRPRRPRWRILAARLIPAALFIGIACTHLPLRLVFSLHRAEFDRVASLIESGTQPQTPFRIGLFRIRMAGLRDPSGTPYLATNEDRWEIEGFVRHPKGQGFNLWSCVTLDESWSYIKED